MNEIKDKTALVTGSTSGIGRATALALAARGARVETAGAHAAFDARLVRALRRSANAGGNRVGPVSRSRRHRSSPSPPGTMKSSSNSAGGCFSASLTMLPIAAYGRTVNPAPSR